MKNLLHNIQILTMLAFIMAGMISCSGELEDMSEVQVGFTATLPTDTHTRSFGEAEQVNTLVVGVFKKGHEVDRQSFPINGTSADVSLSLAKDQTYSFVFWAYDSSQDIYDIDDLTVITMNDLSDPITFSQAESADAFFATKEDVVITGNCSYRVVLVRPLAQINVGTTLAPMQAAFTAKAAPDTFHPFTGTVSGSRDYTWNFSATTTETFLAGGTEYKYLAMGYVFAPTTLTRISAELTLTDGEAGNTMKFPQVEIVANQRSNIAGNFTATTHNN